MIDKSEEEEEPGYVAGSGYLTSDPLPAALSQKRVCLQTQTRQFGLDSRLTSAVQPFDGAVGRRVADLMHQSGADAMRAFGDDPDSKPSTWRHAAYDFGE